jgi:hypothetical protein
MIADRGGIVRWLACLLGTSPSNFRDFVMQGTTQDSSNAPSVSADAAQVFSPVRAPKTKLETKLEAVEGAVQDVVSQFAHDGWKVVKEAGLSKLHNMCSLISSEAAVEGQSHVRSQSEVYVQGS